LTYSPPFSPFPTPLLLLHSLLDLQMSSKQVTIALIAALAAVSHAQFAIPAFPNIPIGNINGNIPKPFLNLNPTPAGPVSGHSAGVNLTGAGSLSSIGVSGNYGYTTPSGNQFGAGINVSPGGALSGSINYTGKFEEDELEVNAGISGGQGKPIWTVGVSHKWEDEQELQSFKTDVLKIAQTIVEADKMGIFEEGAQVEQGLKKIVKKAVKAAVVLNQSGLLEEVMRDEPQSLKSTLKKVVKVAAAVDQAGVLEEGWEVGAGVSGSGGKPTWNVGVKGSWEEEEEQQLDEQKFKLKKTLNKIGKAAGKISNAYDKAQQIGVLEEEGWEVNAGISGSGGKPTWNVGVSHSWEEEALTRDIRYGGFKPTKPIIFDEEEQVLHKPTILPYFPKDRATILPYFPKDRATILPAVLEEDATKAAESSGFFTKINPMNWFKSSEKPAEKRTKDDKMPMKHPMRHHPGKKHRLDSKAKHTKQ